MLFYLAASGDETHPGTFERNFQTAEGAQEERFAGGSQVGPGLRLGECEEGREADHRTDEGLSQGLSSLEKQMGWGAT